MKSTLPGGPDVLYTCVNVTAQWRCYDPNVMVAEAASEFDKAMEAAGWKIGGGSVANEAGECKFTRSVNARIIPISQERWIRWSASTWTLLSTSFVTDYLAPLAIAAAPVVVATCQAAAHYSSLLSGMAR
ncbi:MAG TPA: hypothetical protein VN735_06505 [Steroidobacteraceae bacterium]|nr:hypothetical protein [Steroidobacteraceae bacterium]